MEELVRRLVERGGCLVSSADCSPTEIIDAMVRGDWWVDENGLGFVLRLPEWLALHSMDARGVGANTCENRIQARVMPAERCDATIDNHQCRLEFGHDVHKANGQTWVAEAGIEIARRSGVVEGLEKAVDLCHYDPVTRIRDEIMKILSLGQPGRDREAG